MKESVYKSDLSGEVITADKLATITIAQNGTVRVLHVTPSEASEAYKGKGTEQKKRGRKPGTKNAPKGTAEAAK